MKILSRLLPIAVLIGVVVGFKLYGKHQASEEFRPTAEAFLHAFPDYISKQAYYDSAFDEFHGKAFDQAYSLGGRYSSASFDPHAYHAFLIALVMRDARQDGNSEIAASLDQHREVLGLPEVEFQ